MKHKFHRVMLLGLVLLLMAALATAAAAATPQGFNAQITVDRPDDSTMVVTIDAYSSNILAEQTPTLILPCSFPEAYVTFNGETIDSALEAGEIRFAPAAGGSYTVHAGKDPNAHVHTEVIDAAVAPTCTAEGKTEGKHCAECGEVLVKQDMVPAVGHKDADNNFTCDVCGAALCTEHTPAVIPAADATCTESGLTEGSKCSNCGKVLTAQQEIPAKGHTEVIDTAVAPTCTAEGKTEGKHCSVCAAVLVKQEAVPVKAHSYAEGKCTACGAEDPDYVPEVMENPFTDVKESDYFYNPVLWAVTNEITGGIGDGLFGPNAGCTRGQVVTFLWAAAGRPAPETTENPFTDVKETDYFYKPVLWAVENGITGGIGDGLFGPHQECTRNQIVTFLWASQGKPAAEGTLNFSDVKETDWFAKPVLWAGANEITGGIGNGMFGPNATCTRGQVVTFLYKVYN